MEGYEIRQRRRKRELINRIIFVLNIVVLIVNVVLIVKNSSDDESVQTSAGQTQTSSQNIADNGDGQQKTTEDNNEELTTEESELPYIEPGRDDFSWTKDSTDTKKIINLEYMNQNDYPTGCESVTTWMALNYMGYTMSVDMFIDNYLDKFSIRWGENVMFGEDPNEYFIGDPRTENSFGCYAPVIKKALIEYAGENAVHDLSGRTVDEMIEEYVSKGIPVIFWATIDMVPSIEGRTWYIERTSKTFTWIGKEHCLLLAGWDDNNYYFYDPWENHGIIAYEKGLVKQRYAELGSQALALVKVNEINASKN